MHSQLKQLPEENGTTSPGTTEWSDPVPNPEVLDAVTELQAMVCQSNVRKSHTRRKQTSVKITEYKKQCKMPAPVFEEKGRG